MKNVFVELSKSRMQASLQAEKNLHKAREDETVSRILNEIKVMEYEGNTGDKYEQKVLELGKALKNIGMSITDLIPEYQCNICHDTGMVGDSVCQCVKARTRQDLEDNIGCKLDKTHTFANSQFDLFDDRVEIEKIYTKLHEWIDHIDSSNFKSLILSGSTGVGKTYLAECIANQLIDNGIEVRFLSAFSFSNLLLKVHTSELEDRLPILNDLASVPVLIIDDLGSEPKYKNVTKEYMTSIFGER